MKKIFAVSCALTAVKYIAVGFLLAKLVDISIDQVADQLADQRIKKQKHS